MSSPWGTRSSPKCPLTLAAKFDYRKLEEEITPPRLLSRIIHIGKDS